MTGARTVIALLCVVIVLAVAVWWLA